MDAELRLENEMTLGQKQELFTRCLVLLLKRMIDQGYQPRLKFVSRCEECPIGHDRSLHKSSLAGDIDLFKDGEYLTATEDHREFGEFWEGLHELATWGGHFDDGNHYSITHQGMR